MVQDPFDDDKLCGGRSALIKITPDDMGRYEFEMICQYTRAGLNSLMVGDLIGVENFRSSQDMLKQYSVLSLTQALPFHFAAQNDGAYPGHIFESMRSIKEDWETQQENPQFATTTIRCIGVPTGWQFSHEDLAKILPIVTEDDSLPMVGAEMRPLSRDMVENIINMNLDRNIGTPLWHRTFTDLKVILDKKALLTTHFGIFGFTNAGKSNLISSLISSLMINDDGSTPKDAPNVIIIDPNDEYLGLFIDQIEKNPERFRYIHVGFDSLSESIIRKLKDNDTILDDADRELLYKQMKLPSDLKNDKNVPSFIKDALNKAMKRTKITLPAKDMSSWIREEISFQTEARSGPATKDAIRDATDTWCNAMDDKPINVESTKKALEVLNTFDLVRKPLIKLPDDQKDKANAVFNRVEKNLKNLQKKLEKLPNNALITIKDLQESLNEVNKSQIIIVTGKKDADLKNFATVLGNGLYESRRIGGVLDPTTLLLLDEADLFISNDTKDLITEEMKEMCITFARRGRKFGLGIGIATQRASLLDTQVMANLHTYFVSKLPRKYDREKVAEAFGIGEDQLSPTFSFRPGNWLVISHDATGLKGVPIPVKANNANSRIMDAARIKVNS